MIAGLGRWLIVVGVSLVLPPLAFAQEAVLSGTITDSTNAVLPGAMIRAINEASGNTFEAVADQRGGYRIPVRIGTYRLTAELSGFSTVTRTGVELLVGQSAVINLQMAPGGIAEAVSVTGQSPLLDTTTSSLGGNVDPRQVQELPVNGRNWIALSLLVFIWNFLTSLRGGAPSGSNPWGGATLEWAIPSPPPPHNFGTVPTVLLPGVPLEGMEPSAISTKI